jgi:predicted transcriptional regulator
MVIDSVSVQNRISNHELFCFFDDKIDTMMRLRLEEDDHLLMMKDGERVIAKWNATSVTLDEIRDTANSYAENSYSTIELRLRHFWKQHPRAKFSLDSIAGSVDSTKTNIRNRIGLLIEKGILREQHDEHSTIIYSLNNGNEETQEYIQQIDKLCTNGIGILGYHLAKEAALV